MPTKDFTSLTAIVANRKFRIMMFKIQLKLKAKKFIWYDKCLGRSY